MAADPHGGPGPTMGSAVHLTLSCVTHLAD